MWDDDFDMSAYDNDDDADAAADAAAVSSTLMSTTGVKAKEEEKLKLAPTIVGGGTLLYVLARCARISATDMSDQRKRVREENTKFNQVWSKFV